MIALLDVPDAIHVQLVDGSVFGVFTASWLLVIIFDLITMFMVFSLLLEVAERYMVLAMLTVMAPLAFASKEQLGILPLEAQPGGHAPQGLEHQVPQQQRPAYRQNDLLYVPHDGDVGLDVGECACMVTPAFALDDMWTVANRIIVDVYGKIAGVSTVLAGLMS